MWRANKDLIEDTEYIPEYELEEDEIDKFTLPVIHHKTLAEIEREKMEAYRAPRQNLILPQIIKKQHHQTKEFRIRTDVDVKNLYRFLMENNTAIVTILSEQWVPTIARWVIDSDKINNDDTFTFVGIDGSIQLIHVEKKKKLVLPKLGQGSKKNFALRTSKDFKDFKDFIDSNSIEVKFVIYTTLILPQVEKWANRSLQRNKIYVYHYGELKE